MSRKIKILQLFVALGALLLLAYGTAFASDQAQMMMQGSGGDNLKLQRKQLFEELGRALQSGSLENARASFDKLKESAPPMPKNASNPMKAEMENLGEALDMGDLSGAQEAYSRIREKMKMNMQNKFRTKSRSF